MFNSCSLPTGFSTFCPEDGTVQNHGYSFVFLLVLLVKGTLFMSTTKAKNNSEENKTFLLLIMFKHSPHMENVWAVPFLEQHAFF